ncbi:MAG: alpha/beta hydrolase-fold protein [Limisphaerales bacterium]
MSAVEAKYPAPTNGVRRIIAGHSSGRFGALRLGSSRQQLFDAVIALSPDSDFPTTHLPLVKIAVVTNTPLAKIEKIASGTMSVPRDEDLDYAIGLSAAYAPRGTAYPGEFEWLYDTRGNFREDIWQRWLENDPLTIMRKNPAAFADRQAIYLDGAAKDEFSANIGARKILRFYNPVRRAARFMNRRATMPIISASDCNVCLEWVFNRPVKDI